MRDTDKRLSFGEKAGWGLADMGIVVFVIVKQLLVLSFLTNYLGVPVAIAGMVTTGVLFFDMCSCQLLFWVLAARVLILLYSVFPCSHTQRSQLVGFIMGWVHNSTGGT